MDRLSMCIHIGNKVHRRCWHIWQTVADLTLANVQYSQDQCPESSMFLELLDLDAVPLPLLLLPLLHPPKLFELVVLLHAAWEFTSDRPFSKARTRFSK